MNKPPNPSEGASTRRARNPDSLPADASTAERGMDATSDFSTTNSNPSAQDRFAKLPQKFGRYEVVRLIGKGQMGAVYLAQDSQLDRRVALKIAHIRSTNSAKLLHRMQVEAKAGARIDHPSVCKIFDSGEIDGIRYIALQYIEGENLKKYMSKVGPKLSPAEAVKFCTTILDGLSAAHEEGIIHRDLKPENVMLNKKKQPIIMDFGLARSISASDDAGITQGMIVGTAAYMAPEQAAGHGATIDRRTDLYAVGVMMFEMLTGKWPFTGASIEVIGKKCVQDPPSPLDLNPEIHPRLATICQKMIARNPDDRFKTCREVLIELKKFDSMDAASDSPIKLSDDDFADGEEYYFGTFEEVPQALSGKSLPKNSLTNTPRYKAKKVNRRGSSKNFIDWRILALGAGTIVASILLVNSLMQPGPRELARWANSKVARSKPIEKPSTQKPKDSPKPDSNRKAENLEAVNQVRSEQRKEEPSKIARAPYRETPSPQPVTPSSDEVAQESVEAPVASVAQNLEMPRNDEQEPKLSDSDENMETDDAPPTAERLEQMIVDAVNQIRIAKAKSGKEGSDAFRIAKTILKKASLQFTSEVRPDFYLGILHSGIGINDFDTAEIHFKKALERSPRSIPVMNNLSIVATKARHFSVARNFLGQLSNTKDRPIEFHQNLGRLINQASLMRIPKADLKRFSELSVNSDSYRADKGWMYLPLDPSEKAKAELRSFCREALFEDQSCSVCNGLRGLPCPTCGKSGAVILVGTMSGVAVNNGGLPQGYVKSSSTAVSCPSCNGRGRVDCPHCVDGRDPNLRPH